MCQDGFITKPSQKNGKELIYGKINVAKSVGKIVQPNICSVVPSFSLENMNCV